MIKQKKQFTNSEFISHLNNDKIALENSIPQHVIVASSNQIHASTLINQIREMGASKIIQTSYLHDVKTQLENNPKTELILFDYEMKKGNDTPYTVLEDLKRTGVINFSIVVVFFSSFGNFQMVSNAAEVGIDAFLILPCSYKSLYTRIATAYKRRKEFREITNHLINEDFNQALELCIERFIHKGYGWLYAARIAAEIHFRKGDARKAQEIYNSIILSDNALPWVKIGLGRSQTECGSLDAAIGTLTELIKTNPDQTEAYDIMGRAYFEQGNHDKALEAYTLAVDATPTSVVRLQRVGFASIHAGQSEKGVKFLQKSLFLGIFSRMIDPRTFFLVSVYNLDNNNSKAISETLKIVTEISRQRLNDIRIKRMLVLIEIIECLSHNKIDSARVKLNELLSEKFENDFDHDTASCLITVLSIFAQKKIDLESDNIHIEDLGLRFSHSKFCSVWLSGAAARHEPYNNEISKSFTKVFNRCQESMSIILLNKEYEEGLDDIIIFASKYKNIKAIETAEGMINRYSDKIKNPSELMEKINDLKVDNNPHDRRHYPSNGSLRHPGGINLPTRPVKNTILKI